MKRIKILSFMSIVLVGMAYIMPVPRGKLRIVCIAGAYAVSLAPRDGAMTPTGARFPQNRRPRFAICKLNKAS